MTIEFPIRVCLAVEYKPGTLPHARSCSAYTYHTLLLSPVCILPLDQPFLIPHAQLLDKLFLAAQLSQVEDTCRENATLPCKKPAILHNLFDFLNRMDTV